MEPNTPLPSAFSSCFLFSALPTINQLYYRGPLPPHAQKYSGQINGAETDILVASVIRRSEAPLWEGARDLLTRAVLEASTRVRGVYSFELLSFNALNELATFNFNELAQVITNSTREMLPGNEILIRYSSVNGLLRKIGDVQWGRITLTASIEILPDAPSSIYLLFGRLLKKSETALLPVIILLNDLSAVPLYDSNCETQRAALNKLQIKTAKAPAPSQWEFWVEGIRILDKG